MPSNATHRVLTIIGTRPEAIKMAPVIRELATRTDRFEHTLVSTGQHREMVAQVLHAFGLSIAIDLELMEHDQSLAGFAARSLHATARVIQSLRPDAILVQGDTTTVLSSALAAAYARVFVGHVEAGLRTHDRDNPFPEEINRRVAGSLADIHFAPTERARENLLREGVAAHTVHVVGNTIVDALESIDLDAYAPSILDRVDAMHRLVLVTVHRRESFGAPLEAICRAIVSIVGAVRDVEIILPVHPNPQVASIVRAQLDGVDRVHLVEPLPYPDLLATLKRSALVLSDSGGIQEEAPSLGVPVLVLRDATERPELIESGAGRLVGTDEFAIVREALRLLGDPSALAAMRPTKNPFGDGRSAARIVDLLDAALLLHSAS